MSIKIGNLFKRILSLILVFSLFASSLPSLAHGDSSIYSRASDWAKVEIENAHKKGLLPNMLKGKDMTKSATREELCELAVLLYEKLNGKAVPTPSVNPFTDTKNGQIRQLKHWGQSPLF